MKRLTLKLARYLRPESCAHIKHRIRKSLANDHRATAWREIFNGGEYGFARNWK